MAAQATRDRVSRARQRIELLAQRAGIHKGTPGSAATSEVLDELGKEWQRIDDIRWPGQSFANVDHVLVGPPGIFVIDTRTSTKQLHLDIGARSDDHSAHNAVIDGLAAAAHAVGSLLGLTHRRPIPVLCLVGKDDIDIVKHAVLVCSTDNIVTMLEAMTPALDPAQVNDFADRLRVQLIPVTGQLGSLPQQRR
jgi:hypothetical protein